LTSKSKNSVLFGSKIVGATYEILRGINATLSVGGVLGKIPATQDFTVITASVTLGCRW